MPLAELLESLEEGGLVDELLAEREADVNLDQIETDGVKAAAALKLLQEHQEQLSAELGQRRKLILMLAASCERQYAQCGRFESSLKECERLSTQVRDAQGRRDDMRDDD